MVLVVVLIFIKQVSQKKTKKYYKKDSDVHGYGTYICNHLNWLVILVFYEDVVTKGKRDILAAMGILEKSTDLLFFDAV